MFISVPVLLREDATRLPNSESIGSTLAFRVNISLSAGGEGRGEVDPSSILHSSFSLLHSRTDESAMCAPV